MKPLVFFALAVAVLGTSHSFAASALPRSTPEAQGISSAAILSFVDEADHKLDSLHSVMIVRHGHVVAEGWWTPYAAGTPHELYSLSKSFTSTAVGLAVAEGKLSVDDPVLKFFPEDAPAEPSANLKAMRVSDLLRMSAGHEKEIPISRELLTPKAFLAQPVPFKPGTRFLYNTPATFMLSAIVQKVTGQSVRDYLEPRLFAPLGIAEPTWDANTQGISLGGYGLYVRTEDIAHFGQLYLQKGKWEGKQLLPAAWVETATARQTSNGSSPTSDWDQGYGYQFWRCRHGAYRGDGAFGQYCIVMPEQDAVIAITSGLGDMQAVLNLVWDHLLPAMQPKKLAADKAAQQQLTARLTGLTLPVAKGSASSPTAARVAGKKFVFPPNDQKLESLALESGANGTTLVLRFDGREQRVACGAGAWTKGRVQ
ncbi:MAG TPA: serine hydrolase, partial [Candidatus Limnocylindria bacterium]|nr:serine hydrolase [Candidatus Limnocylindria bacterium]